MDKQSSRQHYQRFAALVLSDEFLSLRQSWLQNKDAQLLFVNFPFLLRGLDTKTVQNFVSDNKADILTTAINCIQNGVNPYVSCPLLLAYPEPDKIIELYNAKSNDDIKPDHDIRGCFIDQALPAEVIIYYIKNNVFENTL